LGIKTVGGASGLIDVATGQPILLFLNGNTVEGHVGSLAGAIAFTVSVSAAGVVTLDQVRALQHPNAADPDDVVTLSAADPITLSGACVATNISNATVDWSSESALTSTFLIGFDYLSGSTTVHETGTLTFDKVAGTYSVALDSPIESITIVTTSGQGVTFQG